MVLENNKAMWIGSVGEWAAILNMENLKEGKTEPSGFVGGKHSRQRPLILKSTKEAIMS